MAEQSRTPQQQQQHSQPKLAQELVDAGQQAFDPSLDAESREAGLKSYNELIRRTETWALLPALNALIKPGVLPPWLSKGFMQTLTFFPLRPDGVRGTMEFVFSVHPSSSQLPPDGTAPQKQGASITQEAVSIVTRLLAAVPASMSAQEWCEGISGQMFHLMDGKDGPDLARTSARIVGFGFLGRKDLGAPGSPGWNVFVQPLLANVDPSLRSRGGLGDDKDTIKREEGEEGEGEVVDLTRDRVLTTTESLETTLKRLKILILSNPAPGLCKRILKPILVQLWSLASWPGAPTTQDSPRGMARTLDVSVLFLRLLRQWIKTTGESADIRLPMETGGKEQRPGSPLRDLFEVTLLQKLLDKAPEKLVSQFDQLLELIVQVLQADGEMRMDDELVGVVLSLLNMVVTAPTFQKSDIRKDELDKIEASLDRLSREPDRGSASQTAANLGLLLRYRGDMDGPDDEAAAAAAPSKRQVEDRRTYDLAMSYMTGADNPPPVISEGINLLSGLIVAGSPMLDVTAVNVLLSKLLANGEDYINLRVIKTFTQLASKHPRSTVGEIADHYLDAQERESTDTRLRFGEALVQVIERLGETFTGEVAQQVGETLVSIAGRRGYRPKTLARQAREERLREMKRRKKEKAAERGQDDDDDDDGDDVMGDGEEEEEEEGRGGDRSRREALAQIVQGWDSKRGAEDVRMRTSALSILGVAMETNMRGMGATLSSSVVDLCVSVLTLEPEVEKGILRRAAIVTVLSFVRALDRAREPRQRQRPPLGFGLTDESRDDIVRTLRYVAETDNDGLVKEHARDVIESLESWQLSQFVPAPSGDAQGLPTISRLAGLTVDPDVGSSNSRIGGRPRIEEVE
ncbi:protein of unknown function (DUF2411) [Geosmithia morbida]|uniref:RNA polymerase II assembly factor RTP1 n=1 Tax=Geosmithia morbida TaxID=1094350 RepID=A0A9P5D3M6_9HYPO|nr:protein of unknown function (DUF2411) [Geosmithia morbida]KAF4126363.1 protein of unknown function (DUF2411) [Geosmithia morbida]